MSAISAVHDKSSMTPADQERGTAFRLRAVDDIPLKISLHQMKLVVIIEPQRALFIHIHRIAVIDRIFFILPQPLSPGIPYDQTARTHRLVPAEITEHALVEVSGNDAAVFRHDTALDSVTQTHLCQLCAILF